MCSFGRRRPFIIVGGVAGCAGIFGQDVASMHRMPAMYYIAFTMSMFALSTAYTAVVGLMADLVPKKQTGTATGSAALQSVLGASSGFLIYDCIPGSSDEDRLHLMYMSYICITAACVLVTCLTSKEVALGADADVKSSQWFEPKIYAPDVISSYWIDPREHFDFTMVFWSRTLYYFSCSVQTFFKFYLKDIVGIADAETAIVRIALIGQFCAAFTAIPAGLLSDRVGNMRKPFIYGACAVLAIGNVANCFLRNEQDALVVGGFLGAANGVYLAMDAALALDHLPSGDEAARFMGVWGIGCFLGAALGPLMGGPILAMSGQNPSNPDAYNYSGYVILLNLAAVGFMASGAVLYRVGARSEGGSQWWCLGLHPRIHKSFRDLGKVRSHGPLDVEVIKAALQGAPSFPVTTPKSAS